MRGVILIAIALMLPQAAFGFVGRAAQFQHAQAVFNITSTARARTSGMKAWMATLGSQNKVMSGQMSWSSTVTDAINTTYGAYPAVRGFDWFAQSDPALVNDAAAWAKNKGVVHMMYHMPNPFAANDVYSNVAMGSFANLVTEGSTENTYWKQSLDKMAATLSSLQSGGVTVIFRPFHEMNGSWFWWRGWSNADFISMWQYAYDYLTVKKSLKNLIWAYSPNAPSGNLAAKYPGSSYVDMVGLDCYNYTNFGYSTEYSTLTAAAPGKLFAVTEFGGCAPGGCDPGGVDVSVLPDTLPAGTVFWMNWESGSGGYFGLDQPNAGTAAILSNSKVITLDEIPTF